MTRKWVGAVLVLALPTAAAADDDYRHARVRHVEDGVSIQRAAEPGAEEAEANFPFLPGDRVWTDERGRVEFQFESGAFLRLDNGTKLDYLDNPGDRVVLRLWSGGLYVHQPDRGGDFEIETPGGVVETRGRGVYRVDARSGETRLSVYEGEASLQGRASVREGERIYARDGDVVRGPMAFDRGDADDFTFWADDRQERVRQARQRPSDLPEHASAFYDELYDHGSWYHEASVGYVWRPRVAFGWQPYMNGRWVWTAYGWTWLAYEPWGWAPFHYGRWGYSPAGWYYWIPRRGWGPAWVRWAVGGHYVGWSPLGFGNRPIIVHERRYRGGHAVPRAGRGAWVYARHGDLTARDVARRRVQVAPGELEQVRVLASPRARLTKDLRVVEGQPMVKVASPRTVRTKPTPGDTVPELRGGNETLPPPIVRRRGGSNERHDRGNSFGAAAGRDTAAAPRGSDSGDGARPASRPTTARPGYGTGDAGRRRAPATTAQPPAAARPETAPATPAAGARPRTRGSDERAAPGLRGREDSTPPRPRAVAPRQPYRDSGAQPRGERGGSATAAPRARERAPRQQSAPPPAARPAPAKSEPAEREAPAGARSRRPKG